MYNECNERINLGSDLVQTLDFLKPDCFTPNHYKLLVYILAISLSKQKFCCNFPLMQKLGCFIHVIDYEWALFSHSRPHPQRLNNTPAVFFYISLTDFDKLYLYSIDQNDNVQLFNGNPTILLYALTFTWATILLHFRQRPCLHLVASLSVFLYQDYIIIT